MSYAASSKYVSGAATTVAYAGPALFSGAIITAAAAAGTLVVYDNASAASGNIVATISVPVNTTQWVDFSIPVMCNNGITFVTTGAAVQTNILFCPSA